jgi:hypothetical protein
MVTLNLNFQENIDLFFYVNGSLYETISDIGQQGWSDEYTFNYPFTKNGQVTYEMRATSLSGIAYVNGCSILSMETQK